MKRHVQAPTIGEWCTVCQRYVQHDNGYVMIKALGREREVVAMRCWACNWWSRFWATGRDDSSPTATGEGR